MDKIKCGGFYVGDGLSIDKNSDGQPVIEISQDVEDALLPAAPSVNGSYVLTCTVSASGAVYSWKSAE